MKAAILLAEHLRRLATVLSVLALFASSLGAQDKDDLPPRSKPLAARTIVGVVYDTSGNVLEGAQLRIGNKREFVTSGADGHFTFTNVDPGKYSIAARKIGFLPQVREVVVHAKGGAIDFDLVEFFTGLTPVVVTAERSGLSGVVGDTAYMIVPGATITVIAANATATTDSAGAFYMPLKPGSYMLRITREGFHSQMASVTVPNKGGKKINIWLTAGGSRAADVMEAVRAEALRERLLVRNAVWDKVMTHEDILKTGLVDLVALVNQVAGAPGESSCMATVNGSTTNVVPLASITSDEIEFVEVNVPKPGSGAVASIHNGASPKPTTNRSCPGVIVWLRR